jgi:hypothetical protein
MRAPGRVASGRDRGADRRATPLVASRALGARRGPLDGGGRAEHDRHRRGRPWHRRRVRDLAGDVVVDHRRVPAHRGLVLARRGPPRRCRRPVPHVRRGHRRPGRRQPHRRNRAVGDRAHRGARRAGPRRRAPHAGIHRAPCRVPAGRRGASRVPPPRDHLCLVVRHRPARRRAAHRPCVVAGALLARGRAARQRRAVGAAAVRHLFRSAARPDPRCSCSWPSVVPSRRPTGD